VPATQLSLRASPQPILRLAVEPVTVQIDGYGLHLETRPEPVAVLAFDYEGQRVEATDPGDRFLRSGPLGMEVVPRDAGFEVHARRTLEKFGALDLECLEDVAVAPDSPASHLLRLEGDVHDYCAFGAYAVPQLRRLGWAVEIDPSYPYRVVEEEPPWYARVEPEGKNDWFGLQIGVELGERRVNLLPALLGLLEDAGDGGSLGSLLGRSRPVALSLPDGRYLPLPTERVQALLRVLGELYDGTDAEAEVLTLTREKAAALARLDAVFLRAERPVRWQDPLRLRDTGRALSEAPPPLVEAESPGRLRATLRDYQVEGVAWLQHLRTQEVGGVLADDMGLGKTLQCIAHVALEKEAGRLRDPALVVSPTSLVGNWRRELAKFAPHLRVLDLTGPRRHGRYADIATHDVILSSYPVLLRDGERLAEHAFHLLVLDEAQAIKNPATKLAKVACELRAEHKLALSGTPMENHLGELWSVFNFLMPGFLGDRETFRRVFRTRIEKEGDADRQALLGQRCLGLPAAPHQGGGRLRAAAEERVRPRDRAHRRAARPLRECPPRDARPGPGGDRAARPRTVEHRHPRGAVEAAPDLLRPAAVEEARRCRAGQRQVRAVDEHARGRWPRPAGGSSSSRSSSRCSS
jgi:hypothetical protein